MQHCNNEKKKQMTKISYFLVTTVSPGQFEAVFLRSYIKKNFLYHIEFRKSSPLWVFNLRIQ